MKKRMLISFLFAVMVIVSVSSAMAVSPATYIIRDDATGGDCTLIGIWDSTTKTCTLISDLYNIMYGIRIDSDGITLDGNGHTISGTGGSIYRQYVGVLLFAKSVTVRNCHVKNFFKGIAAHLPYYGGNNRIEANTVSDNYYGISLYSRSNLVLNNNVEYNSFGIEVASAYNILTGNTVYYNTPQKLDRG